MVLRAGWVLAQRIALRRLPATASCVCTTSVLHAGTNAVTWALSSDVFSKLSVDVRTILCIDVSVAHGPNETVRSAPEKPLEYLSKPKNVCLSWPSASGL